MFKRVAVGQNSHISTCTFIHSHTTSQSNDKIMRIRGTTLLTGVISGNKITILPARSCCMLWCNKGACRSNKGVIKGLVSGLPLILVLSKQWRDYPGISK